MQRPDLVVVGIQLFEARVVVEAGDVAEAVAVNPERLEVHQRLEVGQLAEPSPPQVQLPTSLHVLPVPAASHQLLERIALVGTADVKQTS